MSDLLTVRHVHAVLIHEAPDCVRDLVANLRHLDPQSLILLYDGSASAVLTARLGRLGHHVHHHPRPRPMTWGRLHGFGLDVLRFAGHEFDPDAVTIVDSDQLLLRPGYNHQLAALLRQHRGVGCVGSTHQDINTNVGPANAWWHERDRWSGLLKNHALYADAAPQWTHWPGTVFTRAGIAAIDALWRQTGPLTGSRISGTEEIIFGTLVALAGLDTIPSPALLRGTLTRYTATITVDQLAPALSRSSGPAGAAGIWAHPVPRRYTNGVRTAIRDYHHGYHGEDSRR